MSSNRHEIPITVFTGFLGAGKTSIVLKLLESIPESYKVFVIKNEYGDLQVDSQLLNFTSESDGYSATNSSKKPLSGVEEIINGCLCCTLVGRLSDAIIEVLWRKYKSLCLNDMVEIPEEYRSNSEVSNDSWNVNRIIIETSGSAYPAQLALQLNQLRDQLNERIKNPDTLSNIPPVSIRLDTIITVLDCENYEAYDDAGTWIAQVQAKYTDLIMLNKWENVTEVKLDKILDSLYDDTVPSDTPVVKINPLKQSAGAQLVRLIIGENLSDQSESRLFAAIQDKASKNRQDHTQEVAQVLSLELVQLDPGITQFPPIDSFANFFEKETGALSKDMVYRVKGFLVSKPELESAKPIPYIVNWAFGRYTLEKMSNRSQLNKNTVMQMNIVGSSALVCLSSDKARIVSPYICKLFEKALTRALGSQVALINEQTENSSATLGLRIWTNF